MEEIKQHFRPEEGAFIDRVLEWAELVSQRHRPRLTSFLDPRQQFIVRSVVGALADVKVAFWGGYGQAERKRALILPDYLESEHDQFGLSLLAVEGGSDQLTHRDLLGALLGLGLRREVVGDLLITSESKQVIIAQEMAEYIGLQLTAIGRWPVKTEVIPWSQINPPREEWEPRHVVVSSLRLDAIVAECAQLSRSKATQLIRSGRVHVNWKMADQPGEAVKEGDTLSIRGVGRFFFMGIERKTRKDKFRLVIGTKK